MHLPGRLSTSTLGDLLGSLHRESITGVIELREICRPAAGAACRAAPPRPPARRARGRRRHRASACRRSGEILCRDGLCSREAVRLLVTRIEAGDRRAAGEILQSSGLASADAIRAALRAQLRERVDALFALEDATIGFRTARPLPHALRATPLGPAEFLHGRPRAARRGPDSARDEPAADPRRAGRAAEDPSSARAGSWASRAAPALGEVRRAFRRMARRLHPDRLASAALEEQQRQAARFAELSAAYHLLVA